MRTAKAVVCVERKIKTLSPKANLRLGHKFEPDAKFGKAEVITHFSNMFTSFNLCETSQKQPDTRQTHYEYSRNLNILFGWEVAHKNMQVGGKLINKH